MDNPLYTRLVAKFERDILEVIINDANSGANRMNESGKPRSELGKILKQICTTADLQLEPSIVVKLFILFGSQLKDQNEFTLGIECYEIVLEKCVEITDDFVSAQFKIEALHGIVIMISTNLLVDSQTYQAPMVISKLLRCLRSLRQSLLIIFDLPTAQQEELSWLVLNSCKLILQVGQPLIWKSCGKYVAECFVFAALCMESIINLCTTRHINFRMKFYTATIYAIIGGGGSVDEAQALLDHAATEVKLLREREMLDAPIPVKNESPLVCAEADCAILKCTVSFWKDPDSFSVDESSKKKFEFPSEENLQKAEMYLYTNDSNDSNGLNNVNYVWHSFEDRCLCECSRVQQLSAGNTNEVWKKRSTMLLKIFWKVFESNTDVYFVNELGENPEESLEKMTSPLLSSYCLAEMTIIAMFDATDNIPLDLIFQKIFSTVASAPSISYLEGVWNELVLLRKLYKLTSSQESDTQETIKTCMELVSHLKEVLTTDVATKRKSLIKRIVVGIWSKYVYSKLQCYFSQDYDNCIVHMKQLCPVMSIIVKSLEMSNFEDPILYGSLVLTLSQLLNISDEKRETISLLRQAIDLIDENRAARVDFNLHVPEEDRDILALQNQSICTRSEAKDWFHAFKRLGAHAFAGYGIFGLSSQADRADQALAEIQTEMLSLYFRFEIEYSIHQIKLKNMYKSVKKPDSASESHFNNGWASTAAMSPVIVENLPCISALKSYCCKNSYSKCLLLVEMAKVESNEVKRKEYLMEAKASVEEAESQEKVLKTSFHDSSLMSDASRYPLLLARSHRFIYVANVGCRSIPNVHYYRIVAKEQGSGTDVSIVNDDYAGCEKKIFVNDMINASNCYVCIEPLRNGEKYVFGSVAYTKDDKVIGNVSPTSPAIEAVNPLPTILLWSLVGQACHQYGYKSLYKFCSLRICSRYFIRTPNVDVTTVGKGINLFLDNEPTLCMLAVQQSSPVLLYEFIRAFLLLEPSTVDNVRENNDRDQNSSVHWILRKDLQIQLITSLKRTSMIAIISVYINSHELLIKCICFAYDLIIKLLEYDFLHLAQHAQGPLVTLISCMQAIPKRNWKPLEHKIYTRMLYYLLKCGVANRNTSPISKLMVDVIPETLDTNVKDQSVISLIASNASIELDYTMLLNMTRISNNIMFSTEFEKQLQTILATNIDSTTGNLWSISHAKQQYALRDNSKLLSSIGDKAIPELVQLDHTLRQNIVESNDLETSMFLDILVRLLKEVTSDLDIIIKLLSRYLISYAILSIPVQEACREWNLSFIKGTAFSEEENDKSKQSSVREVGRQFRALGEICLIIANIFTSKKNYYPGSVEGPLQYIDPYNRLSLLDLDLSNQSSEEITSDYFSDNTKPFSKLDYVRYLSASITFMSKAKQPFSVTKICSKLWNYIVDEWITPKDFATHFLSDKTIILSTLSELVGIIQLIADVNPDMLYKNVQDKSQVNGFNGVDESKQIENVGTSPVEKMNGVSTSSEYPTRIVKENMLICRELIVYLLKVLWLFKFYDEVVKLGLTANLAFSQTAPELSLYIGTESFPLLSHAQEQLIEEAQSEILTKQQEMDTFVADFEEYLKKKRRKKLRIARVDKDEDDIRFDAEKEIYQEKVQKAKNLLIEREAVAQQVTSMREIFEFLESPGMQQLNKARLARKQMLIEVCESLRYKTLQSSGMSTDNGITLGVDELIDFRQCIGIKEYDFQLDDVATLFKNAGYVLRERQERLPLLECMKELGDLYLIFGLFKEAKSVWCDAIDGIFNSMDSCSNQNWVTVIKAATDKDTLNSQVAMSIIPTVTILGKLSKYCSSDDWEKKSIYCRMAAELLRTIFMESCGHPQTTSGFAAYECTDIGGLASFLVDSNKITSYGITVALEEILFVLHAEEQQLIALPVVVVLEHFHGNYTRDASKWLDARIIRTQLLIDLHLFAEAASMLASIKNSIIAISNCKYTDILRQKVSLQSSSMYDTRSNGLDFYGLAPFFNNLPPHDDANKDALSWIVNFGKEFKEFASAYTIKLPEPILTPDELLKKKEEERIAAEEAAKLAAKNKGKKNDEQSAVVAKSGLTKPLFTLFQESAIYNISGLFLKSIAALDNRKVSPYVAFIQGLSNQAEDIIVTSIECLNSIAIEDKDYFLRNHHWIKLYGQCQIIRVSLLINKRNFKVARSLLMGLSAILKHPLLQQPISAETKSVITQLWLMIKFYLADISDKQARHDDTIKISSAGATEASLILNGYWLRMLLSKRANALYKLGRYEEALVDLNSIFSNVELSQSFDLNYVRFSILYSVIKRDTCLISSHVEWIDTMTICAKQLKKATSICEELASKVGFRGADSNYTFDSIDKDGMISKYSLIPPLLHNLTQIHQNNPDLTLPAIIKIKLDESLKNNPNTTTTSTDSKSNLVGFRLGPVDLNETTYAKSNYCNLYFEEVRVLIACSTMLCTILDEILLAGFSAITDSNIMNSDSTEVQVDVVKEQILYGENGLKLLRHNVYCCPFVRVSLLLSTGKSRMLAGKSIDRSIYTEPLTNALSIAITSAHSWDLIKLICIQLVECYANPTFLNQVATDEFDDNRMVDPSTNAIKIAACYIVHAIRASNQMAMLTRNPFVLSSDISFNTAPDEIIYLLESLTSSSATKLPELNPAAVPIDPKAKAPSKGATASSGVDIKVNGRDAIFLLSSIMRETNSLLLDCFEREVMSDLHNIMKKVYPVYSNKCSLSNTPDPNGNLTVPASSIYTLWMFSVAPADDSCASSNSGLYTHACVYFLLGPKSSGDPILTKLCLLRKDVNELENRLRNLSFNYADSVEKKVLNDTMKLNYGDRFGNILVDMVNLFQNGRIIITENELNTSKEFNIDVAPDGVLGVTFKLRDDVSIKFTLTEQLINKFADIMSCDKDLDALLDSDINSLLITTLGF